MKKAPGNWLVALAVAMAGIGIWFPQWRLMRERERETAALRERIENAKKASAEAESDLKAARRRADKAKSEEVEAWKAEGKARSALEKIDPDARWASPPMGTPEWNASPYTWLPKEQLTNFGLTVFADDGRLTDSAASAFAVDRETLEKLNAELAQYVSDYKAMEATNAERVEASTNAMTLRIKAMPEAASQFAAEMQRSLEDALGAQRAGLLMQLGRDWVDSFGASEKTYAVERKGNGWIEVRVEGGGASMSTDVPDGAGVARYIPPTLYPMFADEMDLSNTEKAQ